MRFSILPTLLFVLSLSSIGTANPEPGLADVLEGQVKGALQNATNDVLGIVSSVLNGALSNVSGKLDGVASTALARFSSQMSSITSVAATATGAPLASLQSQASLLGASMQKIVNAASTSTPTRKTNAAVPMKTPAPIIGAVAVAGVALVLI